MANQVDIDKTAVAIAAIMDTLDFAYSTNFDNFAFLLCTSQTFKTSFMLIRKVRAFV